MSPYSTERRAWPRRKDTVRVAVTDVEDALEQPFTGWVVDRSAGGLCISFDPQPLSVGKLLTVQPYRSAAPVEVRVKNARRKAGQVQVGCEFVHPGGDHMLWSPAPENWLG